jgi:hypothetical protein
LPIDDTVTSIACPGLANGGHRGDVLQLRIHARRNRHAELVQHRLQALHGERRLRGLVARAVQPDHQAVADQRVVAHAFDRGEILDALGARRAGEGEQGGGEQDEKAAHSGISTELKKRLSQPIALDFETGPRPP